MSIQHKLLTTAPSDQNVIDLFQGEWTSAMPEGSGLVAKPGHAPLFADHRIGWAAHVLGSFEGLDILELGPLEGAHAAMFERMGARSVTAIEANTRAFLKCLCIKEVLGLSRVRFKLGSFLPFLETCGRYDLIVASGVLYHMTEPLLLLERLTARADRLLIWTHYFDARIVAGRPDRGLFEAPGPVGTTSWRGARRHYPQDALSWQGFSGGGGDHAIWLERESLLGYLTGQGFRISINFDEPDHPNGPALALCAQR